MISLVAIVLTECISHAAVVAILMPVGMGMCKTTGMDPKVMTLSIALPAGLAYCLPMGTPATAIAYASGYLKSRDIIVSGAVIMAISWLLFMASVSSSGRCWDLPFSAAAVFTASSTRFLLGCSST